MKERFEIYDGSAEAKKAKGKSKNLSGFHPLFTASARRSIALDSLKIWLLLGFVVGVVTGVATGAGAVSVLLGLLIAAVIYFGFRDDVYKKVYGPEHDRGQLPLPEGMSWEEAVDRIRRGFANPDVEQVTDTADAMTFYSKKHGTYQLKNTADGLKMTILTRSSKSSKKEYLYAVFSSVLLSQVIAILYPEKISAEQVEEEKAAVRKLFGAHKMPLVIELAITAAFVAFAVYMLYPALYSDSARSKGVSDSHLNGFPAEATVGEVLDDFFSDGKWDNFQQDGVTIVRYTGTGVDTENGEKVIVSIYFKRKDDGTGEIDRISWNGETLSELEQIGVILTLSNSYCESHGLASSNAIDMVAQLCEEYSTQGETIYHAVWSNQCVELWYLLHFMYMDTDIDRSRYWPKLSDWLKNIGAGSYEKNRPDMYEVLRPYMDIAIANAKRLDKQNEGQKPSESAPGTKVYELVEMLKPYLSDTQ